MLHARFFFARFMHKTEISYGIIPLRKLNGKRQVLLVKHGKGHWSFPKGHPETGETPQETAVRECEEETSLHIVSFLNIPPHEERYFFRRGSQLIDKRVTYFAAEVSGEVAVQAEEITDFKWLSLEEAEKWITFSEARALLAKISHYLI